MKKITFFVIAVLVFSVVSFAQINLNKSNNIEPRVAKIDNNIYSFTKIKSAYANSKSDYQLLSMNDSLLMNWEGNDNVVIYSYNTSDKWGYAFGTNSYGDVMWGEKYIINKPAKVTSVLVVAKGTAVSNNKARVYILTANGDVLGVSNEIAYKNMTLTSSDPNMPPITTFTFATPANVVDTFYVALSFDNYDKTNPNSDKIGLYSTKIGDREIGDISQNFTIDQDNNLNWIESIAGKLNLFLWPKLNFCAISPTVDAGPDQTITSGSSATLNMTVTGGDATTPTYVWVGSNNTSYNTKTIVVSPTTKTKYLCQVDYHGCLSNIDSVFVSIGTNVTCNMSVSISKPNATTLQANVVGATGNVTYLWNTQATTAAITIPNVTATYHVTATDANNCTATANYIYNAVNGISSVNKIFDNVSIYPSPTNENLTIKFSSKEIQQNTSIRIYSIIGKMVYNEEVGKDLNGDYSKTIDVRNFNKGLYLIQIENNKGSINRKFEIR